MSNWVEEVKKFHKAVGQKSPDLSLIYLYGRLVEEEYFEWVDAPDKVEELDAICDLIVVLIGLALVNGYDIEGAMKEVFRSNNSKIDKKTGLVLKDENGKVMKPKDFSPPELEQFV